MPHSSSGTSRLQDFGYLGVPFLTIGQRHLSSCTMAFVHLSLYSFCHCVRCKNTITFWTKPKHTQPFPIDNWSHCTLYATLCHTCSKAGEIGIHGSLIDSTTLQELIAIISATSSVPHIWRRDREIVCTDLRVIMTMMPPWDEVQWAHKSTLRCIGDFVPAARRRVQRGVGALQAGTMQNSEAID